LACRRPGKLCKVFGVSLPTPFIDVLKQIARDRGRGLSELVAEALLFWRLHDKQGSIAGDREIFLHSLSEIKKRLVRLGEQISQEDVDEIKRTYIQLGGKLDEESLNQTAPTLYSYDFASNPHKISPSQIAIWEMGTRLRMKEAELAKRLSMLPTEKH